jgi:hypothetical protein
MEESKPNIYMSETKPKLLKYFIVAIVTFITLLTDIFSFFNFILIIIIFITLLLPLSIWLDNKDRYIGTMVVRRIFIPSGSIFIVLPSLLSTIKFISNAYILSITYFITLLSIIIGFNSIRTTMENYSVKSVYFKTIEMVFVSILMVFLYFELPLIFAYNFFIDIFANVLLILSVITLISGLAYLGIDSNKKRISLICSYISINTKSYGFLAFVDGISIELYNYFSGILKILFILIIFFSIVYVILDALKTIYNSLEETMEKHAITNFKKFDRTVGLTSIDIVNDFAKSIQNFEKYGIKESLLINLTTYLAENGHNTEEIEEKLKPLIIYKVPSSLLIGIYGKNSNVSWEVRKRSEIISRIFKTLNI